LYRKYQNLSPFKINITMALLGYLEFDHDFENKMKNYNMTPCIPFVVSPMLKYSINR
jgi:hypothetical protein